MGKRILFVLLLLVGTWCDATLAWARGGSLVTPPTEMVGQIRVVDRTRNRIVMEERDLEVWATDQRQLEGLAPGQKVSAPLSATGRQAGYQQHCTGRAGSEVGRRLDLP